MSGISNDRESFARLESAEENGFFILKGGNMNRRERRIWRIMILVSAIVLSVISTSFYYEMRLASYEKRIEVLEKQSEKGQDQLWT